jgi:uncharacterized protein YecE (DUF72 family)
VVAKAWVAKTPADFTFAVKLWQKFTHPVKISRSKTDERWEPAAQRDYDEFRAGILPLAEAGKLGVLLLQYPTSFHGSAENMEKIANTLRWFYDYPKVVELRHQSWNEQKDQLQAMLLEHRAGWALIDEPKFATSIRQDFRAVGAIFYFRAHGRNARAWWHPQESWQRYDYLYSREEVRRHADRIKIATNEAGVQKAFAFYNNHARANAAANAVMLSQELGLRLKAMPPEAMVTKFPELVRDTAG